MSRALVKKIMWIVTVSAIGLRPQPSLAALTKEDLKEIRQVIREELKPIETRIDGVEKRLDDVNAKFAWVFTLMGVMVGSVVWLARQDRPITQRHYEQILAREDHFEEELRAVKKTLETLKPHKA